jgi:hypothetical protein
MFEIKKDYTKYNILATGSGWDLAPKQTEKIILALNDYVKVERYGIKPDILFMLDLLDEKPQVVSGHDNLGEIVQRINQMRVPFVGPYKYVEIPMSEEFPIEECVKEFGIPYFTNTICYMIAYALLKGAKEINLYGVNQAGSHEYAEERGGVEYWLGIAVGRGVKVTINGKDSQLLKYKGRYGFGILYGYLQDYKSIQETKTRFGAPIVHKLLKPSMPFSKTILSRKVN